MLSGLKRLLPFIILLFVACLPEEKSIGPIELSPGIVFRTITDLPNVLPESSGLEIADSVSFYSINDSKGEAELYAFDTTGNLIRTIKLEGAENIDWEDLAQDVQGNIYIPDSGNNDNERTNLKVFKIPSPATFSKNTITVETIYFAYENQLKFPAPDSVAFFDSEASFVFEDSLYFLIKDRSKPYVGKTLLYQISAMPGDHSAVLKGEFRTLKTKKEGSITSADISPSGTKMAMISQRNVWIFSDFPGNNFFEGKIQFLSLPVAYQLEGVVFANDCLLYLTNEKNKRNFSALHQLTICD